MFETAVCDGANKLRLQEKVLESGGMDASIAALGGDFTRHGCLLRIAISSYRIVGGIELLVGVVNEIFGFMRHVDGC